MNEYEMANGHKGPRQYRSWSVRTGSFPTNGESEQLVSGSVPSPLGSSGCPFPHRSEPVATKVQAFLGVLGGLGFIAAIVTLIIQRIG